MSQPLSPPLDTHAEKRGLRIGLATTFIVIIVGLVVYGINGLIPKTEVRQIDGYVPWNEKIVETAAQIPIQDGGRVKPLGTYARFRMLSFHGALTMKVASGGEIHKIGPVEWMLDCLFRPELADDLPIFRLDDTDILRPFGINRKDRRDRLSFNDLRQGGNGGKDGFQLLIDEGREILQKQEHDGQESLSRKEKMTADFAQTVLTYTGLRDSLEILRGGLPVIPPDQLAYVDPKIYEMLGRVSEPSRFSFWIPILDRLIASTSELDTPEARQLEFDLNRQLTFARYGPSWIPPVEKDNETWITLGLNLEEFLKRQLADSTQLISDLRKLESLALSASSYPEGDFGENLLKWEQEITKRAEEREEGPKLLSEVKYYNKNYFMNSLVWFTVAFLIAAAGWVVRQKTASSVINILTIITFSVATYLILAGIVHRIYLTGRPPVSNLYDTIPVITATAVILLAAVEFFTRRRFFLSIGAALGVVGLFFAFRYELGDGKDNMDPLRAVLDSNYWLATHVMTITIGYAGGLVACFLSIIYSFLALAGAIKDSKAFQRFMTRAVYGVICFTLLFSLVGTVLGGIWANDSWGRFWGWDPKENGALLIVLWTLIILHCRLAGWIKSWGIHIMSIFLGVVVIFSWFGVNMLGVGLHSYGFMEGAEAIYYCVGALIAAMLAGIVAWALDRKNKIQPTP